MKYSIGTKVKVVKVIDDEGDPRYVGCEGEVVELKMDGYTGETEDDPLHVVRFTSFDNQVMPEYDPIKWTCNPEMTEDDRPLYIPVTGYRDESFWYEELKQI